MLHSCLWENLQFIELIEIFQQLSGLALDADCKLHVDAIFAGLRTSEAAGVQAPLVRNLINLRQSRWGSGGFAELVDSESTTPTLPTFHSRKYFTNTVVFNAIYFVF